jgi:precorrin-8X/cobalt-precorrin-8 methylmutase
MNEPSAIAAESFAVIRAELHAAGYRFDPTMAALVERIIHSTADFEFAAITRASPGALDAGLRALRQGRSIVTDVQMVRVGISATRLAALGGALHCLVADAATRAQAESQGLTRSATGIRCAAEQGLLDDGIVAIGNAPTALYEVIRLVDTGLRPALVIGVPVGFVNTVESKAALMQLSAVPWIVTVGRKGGSPVAVAIVNALLRLAGGAGAAEVD